MRIEFTALAATPANRSDRRDKPRKDPVQPFKPRSVPRPRPAIKPGGLR
ncbi:hypothetical protein [Nonomuraea sp. NPDC049784]